AGGVRADGPSATGSVTRTVVSADAFQYNLSLSGTLHIRWMVDPTPMASGSDAYAASMAAGMLQEASLSGYTSFRASDLAIIKEVRTLEVDGSAATTAGTFPAIPVSMGRPEILSGRPGIVSAPSDPAIGFDHEMPVEPLHSAQTWYSGTVKNVVKFHLFTAGMRLNLVLSSYHIA